MSGRDLIHRALDGEELTREESAQLELLLDADADARALHDDLRQLQSGLRSLPAAEFPEEALDDVLRQTSRRGRRVWVAAGWAAAALLLLALGLPALRELTEGPEPTYTAEQVAEAERQLEQVLGLTSSTIDRSARRGAELIRQDVSPALRRVPLLGDGGGS